MKTTYKPLGYNSVSPYFVVDGAQKFIDLILTVFEAKPLRRYERPDNSIMHAEVQIDDSVIMLSDATKEYPGNQLMMHVYVADVEKTYQKAIDAGCEAIEKPKTSEGDPDKRGSFKDFAGNHWSVSTQKMEE